MQASSAFIGVLKWVAAQVIVAHHLAAYGPLAQKGHAAMPQLFGWLTGCGAWTVSVFLVVSGFLTAQALDGKNIDLYLVRHALIRRYWRLAPVYAVGLGLSVAMAVFFHPWVSPDMLPQQLDASILLGNLFFLQDILGLEALVHGHRFAVVCFIYRLGIVVALGILQWFARAQRGHMGWGGHAVSELL